MSATSPSTLAIPSLSLEGVFVNHSAFSSVLTLLGWQDKLSVTIQANEAEHALAQRLKSAYLQYSNFPDRSSTMELNRSLTAVIDKLEKDKITAIRLAKDAKDRLKQASHVASGFTSRFTATFKSTFGSDDKALIKHYTQLAATYASYQQELSQLRNTLQKSIPETTEIAVHTTHQRRLLQASCYITGSCNLNVLDDGVLGFVANGQMANDYSGGSVSVRDINGDGFSDLIVGAFGASSSAGKTYVVFGFSNTSTWWGNGSFSLSSLATGNGARGFVVNGEVASDQSGRSVSAGDINGDGFSDLIVGAPLASGAAGKTYVVFGSSNTSTWGSGSFSLSSLATGNGAQGFVVNGAIGTTADVSGWSVSAGDINGDGKSDLIVGAYNAAPPAGNYAGRTYVVFGSSNPSAWGSGSFSLSSLATGNGAQGFVVNGEAASDQSGWSVSAGDINGDGKSDLIVGTYVPYNVGKAYVIFGSSNPSAWGNGSFNLSSLAGGNGARGFVVNGEMVGDYSGWSVSAGDINGDGRSDLIVGAPKASNEAGKTYVVFGSNNPSVWGSGSFSLSSLAGGNGAQGFVVNGKAAGDRSGSSVSAGDINGDGLSDLLIGAPEGIGKTYVIFGSSNPSAWGSGSFSLSGLETGDGARGFVVNGEMGGDYSGWSVSAGDINGDGKSDLVTGAYGASAGAYAGKTYVVFGSLAPTPFPTKFPTLAPTSAPTGPTQLPTLLPTSAPRAPTRLPTLTPTSALRVPTPLSAPTSRPTLTSASAAVSGGEMAGITIGVLVALIFPSFLYAAYRRFKKSSTNRSRLSKIREEQSASDPVFPLVTVLPELKNAPMISLPAVASPDVFNGVRVGHVNTGNALLTTPERKEIFLLKQEETKKNTPQEPVPLISDAKEQKLLVVVTPEVAAAPEKTKSTVLGFPSSPSSPRLDGKGALNISFAIPFKDLEFKEEDKLGEGAYGTVYKGQYKYNEVAIKKLHAKHFSQAAIDEFNQEASIMGSLRSDYIVQLRGVCFEEPPYCMVMELMPKGSLYGILQNSPELSLPLRYRIGLDVAYALYQLHDAHILHRDLKSLNVLLDDRLRAKVTDFGLSKMKSEVGATASTQGMKGTLGWMAPELFGEAASATSAADLYAYGMILWELIIKPYRTPFHGLAPISVMAAKVTRGEKQETLPADCPAPYADLVRSCWKKPEERPSAKQVAASLNSLWKEIATATPQADSKTRQSPGELNSASLQSAVPEYGSNLASLNVSGRDEAAQSPASLQSVVPDYGNNLLSRFG